MAESFERIHRSNLVGMGVIPLQYKEGQSAESLGLSGKEKYTIRLPEDITTGQTIDIEVGLMSQIPDIRSTLGIKWNISQYCYALETALERIFANFQAAMLSRPSYLKKIK